MSLYALVEVEEGSAVEDVEETSCKPSASASGADFVAKRPAAAAGIPPLPITANERVPRLRTEPAHALGTTFSSAYQVYKKQSGTFSGVILLAFCAMLVGIAVSSRALPRPDRPPQAGVLVLGGLYLLVFVTQTVFMVLSVALCHFGLRRIREWPDTEGCDADGFRASLRRVLSRDIAAQCCALQAASSGAVLLLCYFLSVADALESPAPRAVLFFAAAFAAAFLLLLALLSPFLLPLLADGTPLFPALRLAAQAEARAPLCSAALVAMCLGEAALGVVAFGFGVCVTVPVALLMCLHGYNSFFELKAPSAAYDLEAARRPGP
eukprot:tig00021234_g19405.t1